MSPTHQTGRDLAPGSTSNTRTKPGARRGRGAVSNASGRFEVQVRQPFDDGWNESADDATQHLVTTVQIDRSRSVISTNASPDIPFDRSINPYRGCEHGCVYCYARPTHAWLGLSPGLDFESRLFAKPDAAEQLRRELARPGYVCRAIALGTNTDPYQPIERRYEITRRILEVLNDCNHPVTIVTKSNLVVRDRDILSAMAARGLARVAVSITTLDRSLARHMEPRAPTPGRRLDAVGQLSAAGIPTGVMVAPVIPALTDHESESILSAAADRGAFFAGYVMLRLPLEIADLFREWLDTHEPGRAGRVLSGIRALRGGRLNTSAFGRRMRGEGQEADLLARRFALACGRLGLSRRHEPLDCTQFERPAADGRQMSLL
ncbi:MAG: PA0069 family radical SAM protein [Alphaproteobacteria bacterium]